MTLMDRLFDLNRELYAPHTGVSFGVISSSKQSAPQVLLSLTAGTTNVGLTASSVRGYGARVLTGNDLIGATVTAITYFLRNAMVSTATFGVWDSSDVEQIVFGTHDLNTLTGSYVGIRKENLVGHVVSADDSIGMFFTGSLTTTQVQRNNVSVEDNMNGNIPNSSIVWNVGNPAQDPNIIIEGFPA